MAKIIGGTATSSMLIPDLKQTNPNRADFVKNKQIFASAINNTASGEAIALTDISPIEHTMGVKVSSKNILPILTAPKTTKGVTLSKVEDYYVLNGTCSATTNMVLNSIALGGGMYTLSANNPQHTSTNQALIQLYSANAAANIATYDNTINGVKVAYLPQADDYSIRIRLVSGFKYDNFIIKPQLELGATVTPYTPPIDVSTVNVIVNDSASFPVNTDGTVEGVNAIYPITTITTDKAGVVLDVAYNTDTNKSFSGLAADIDDLTTTSDIVINQNSALTKYSIGVNSILENTNTYLEEKDNYAPTTTTDLLGVSGYRICKSGDLLKYKLSNQVDKPIIATYDKHFNVTNVILGQGQSTYLEGEYAFAEGDVYFRICGCTNESYRSKYYITYETVYFYSDPTAALPDYYTEYMAEKITAINDKDCLIGNHGDSFVFITDTHTPRNKMYSPALIKEIVNNTAVRFVINGGDSLDNEDTRSGAISQLREWRNLMRGINEYRIMGNHDLNKVGNTIEAAYLSIDDWYGTMVKPLEDTIQTDGKYYFCIDNESQKIRYICLSYLNNANTERSWLKERLTELSADWTVLIISHYLFGDELGVIHTNGQYVIDDINEVYSTMKADFIGILAGHTHADYSATEPTNGYNLIATTCDTFTGTPTKTAGTHTEQAFDVIHIDTTNRKMYATRIGAGNDREWSY